MELIIATITVVIAIWLLKTDRIEIESITGLLTVAYISVIGVFIAIYSIMFITRDYSFDIWNTQREVFIETFKSDPENIYMRARAVTYNEELAKCKYKKNTKYILHLTASNKCEDTEFILIKK